MVEPLAISRPREMACKSASKTEEALILFLNPRIMLLLKSRMMPPAPASDCLHIPFVLILIHPLSGGIHLTSLINLRALGFHADVLNPSRLSQPFHSFFPILPAEISCWKYTLIRLNTVSALNFIPRWMFPLRSDQINHRTRHGEIMLA